MVEVAERAEELSLTDFAAISAAIDAGVPRDEAIAGAGLTAEAWEAAKERWLAKLARDAASGKLTPSKVCVEIVGAERPRAAAKAQKSRRKPKGKMPVAPAPVAAPLAGPSKKLVTSAMRERDRGASPVAPPPIAPSPVAPPQIIAPPQVITPQAASSPPRKSKTLTGPISPVFVGVRGLPFAPAAAEPNAPAPSDARKDDRALPFVRSGQQTDTRGDALPFARPPTQEIAAVAVPPRALPFARPPTQEIAAAPAAPPVDRALPFARPSSPAPGAAPAPPPSDNALPFRRPPPPSQPIAAPPSQPVTASPSPPAAAANEAMQRARAMKLPEYANLCAGIRAFPDHVSWLQSRYGLDDDAWKMLHSVWRARIAHDEAMKAQWEQLVEQSLPHWKRSRPGA